MESQPESKQNLPPLPLKRLKVKPQKMAGIPAIRRVAFSLHRVHNGGIVREFFNGRKAIKALRRKWAIELDYRLRKNLQSESVRFEYEWHDDSGHSY